MDKSETEAHTVPSWMIDRMGRVTSGDIPCPDRGKFTADRKIVPCYEILLKAARRDCP